jgi:hypothetical protein
VHYSGLIYSDSQNQVTEQKSIHKSLLSASERTLAFSNKRFKLAGNWEKSESPIESILYQNGNGMVNWSCHHPLSLCNITYQNKTFSGWGYAETLFLSVKPWHLPIDELRWGRFLAFGISIIWIQWMGKNPINKVYLNGKEFNDAKIYPDQVLFDAGKNKIVFSEISVIRQVKFSNHLSGIPYLKILLSKTRILNTLETKYKSKGMFTSSAGFIHSGWCIYEIVIWTH